MYRILQALWAKAEDLAKPGWGAAGHRPGVAGCEVTHEVLSLLSLLLSAGTAWEVCLGVGMPGDRVSQDKNLGTQNDLFLVAWMHIP